MKKKRFDLLTISGMNRKVYFILHFISGGRRGAASAEHFLENGYRVIFLHRKNSLQPFLRNFPKNVEFSSLFTIEESGKVQSTY